MASSTHVTADCGGTSCNWAVREGDKVSFITVGGHNFARQLIESWQIPEFPSCPDTITIYGAGLSGKRVQEAEEYLKNRFPEAAISCHSDLLGAARALCGSEPGIVAILGTGSIAAFYDGEAITKRVPPLGYILGDEGSATALGREFVKLALRSEILGVNIREADVLEHVYQSDNAAAFLASFCPQILALSREDSEVRRMVCRCFESFISNCLSDFDRVYPVNLCGSVAWHFQDLLLPLIQREGYKIGKLLQSPLDSLVR